MNILIVLTSHDRLGDTDHKTGFWLDEFVTAYYVFKDSGANLTLASPAGAQPPIDPNSELEDSLSQEITRFRKDSVAQQQLANTINLKSVSAADYDAIFYPGGHGLLWDLVHCKINIALIEAFNLLDKPIGAVCHGPAVLCQATIGDGQPLIADHRVTGFSNTELASEGLVNIVPFLLENMLKQKGASYERADDGLCFVVQDRMLITGQNPASATATAQTLVNQLM